MSRITKVLIWVALFIAIFLPISLAAQSPLLEWRAPVYIVASFAGIFGLALLLVQPLLAGGYLPGIPKRRTHRIVGAALVAAIVIHVAGLWITSPPDMIDALLFVSPTPFSAWGVVAMWAIFGAALWAIVRRRLGLRPLVWRFGHSLFAIVIVIGSVVHAMLIDGTMETITKVVLSALVLAATVKVMADLRVWTIRRRRDS